MKYIEKIKIYAMVRNWSKFGLYLVAINNRIIRKHYLRERKCKITPI